MAATWVLDEVMLFALRPWFWPDIEMGGLAVYIAGFALATYVLLVLPTVVLISPRSQLRRWYLLLLAAESWACLLLSPLVLAARWPSILVDPAMLRAFGWLGGFAACTLGIYLFLLSRRIQPMRTSSAPLQKSL